MEIIKSDNFNGWFVGDFEPCLLKNKYLEFGFKRIKANSKPDYHFHNIKTEYTILIEGQILLENDGRIIEPITTIILYPKEKNNQHYLKDSLIMIINVPSVKDDKYL